jgi:hypothetical protein
MNHAREPRADLRAAAHSTHEVFISLLESGFTEDQALRVIAYCIANAPDDDDA